MVGQRLYSQNFLVMETMAAVAFYYILIVTVFDFLLKWLERYLDVTQRKTTRQVDAQMQQLATANRPAMARSVTASQEPALQASKLHKAYNNVEVLGAVSLKIQPGEVVSARPAQEKPRLSACSTALSRSTTAKSASTGSPLFILTARVSRSRALWRMLSTA